MSNTKVSKKYFFVYAGLIVFLLANLSCSVKENPRITLLQTTVTDPITLTITVDSIPGKYIDRIEIRDPFTDRLLESSERNISQADSLFIDLTPGAYSILAIDDTGIRYLFNNFKHTEFSSLCTICSEHRRSNNYCFGVGSDSLIIVNQIEPSGEFNYELNQLHFSTVTSNTWDFLFLPATPLGYNDSLTLFFDMDEAPYDIMLIDQDYYQYIFEIDESTVNTLLNVNDAFLDNGKFQRNIYIINMLSDTIAAISSGWGINYIEEKPIAPYDTSFVFASYGIHSLQLEDCARREYIIPSIKCTESMSDIYVKVEPTYSINRDYTVPTASLHIDNGTTFVNIINLTDSAVQSLTIRNRNNNSYVSYPPFSTVNSFSQNSTMPVYLQIADYEIWCLFSDQATTLLKTFSVTGEADTTIVQLFPSEITQLPERYSVGGGTSRIDIINGLLASSITNIYLEPSSSSFWRNDVSGAISLLRGDTLSIFCEADRYDLLIVDTEGDMYTFWNTELQSDSIYECILSYEQSNSFLAHSQIDSTALLIITNDTPYELWYGYIREHGSFGWDFNNTDIFPDDEIVTCGQTFRYPIDAGCYDLLIDTDDDRGYQIYYSQDSIYIASSDIVSVTLTAANRTTLSYEPEEITPGNFTVGDGTASIEIVNGVSDNLFFVFLSPSNSPNWGGNRLGDEYFLQTGEKLTIFTEPGTYDLIIPDHLYDNYLFMDVVVADSERITVLPKTSVSVQGRYFEDPYYFFDSMSLPGGTPSITYQNDLNSMVYQVNIRDHDQPEWGKNLLLSYTLNIGSRIVLPVSNGCYDLRAETRSHTTGDIVNVYELDSIVVSDSIEFVWEINEESLALP